MPTHEVLTVLTSMQAMLYHDILPVQGVQLNHNRTR